MQTDVKGAFVDYDDPDIIDAVGRALAPATIPGLIKRLARGQKIYSQMSAEAQAQQKDAHEMNKQWLLQLQEGHSGARSGGGGAGGSRTRLRVGVERLVAGAAGHGSGGGES